MDTRMSQEQRIGRLTFLPSGILSIIYADGEPEIIRAGDSIFIAVSGSNSMALTRVEFDHKKKSFYSVDGYPLKVENLAESAPGMGL